MTASEMPCAPFSGRGNAPQTVCTASASAAGGWWAPKRTIDPDLVFSNSGQSGMLSRLAERRKITAASAINFECWNTKFKTCFYLTPGCLEICPIPAFFFGRIVGYGEIGSKRVLKRCRSSV